MSQEKINVRIQSKVDSSDRWWSNNTLLLDKEIGYERETGKYKIGDGVTLWRDLPYASADSVIEETPEGGYQTADSIANSKFSTAFGCQNQAGAKAFAITAINTSNSSYTLDSTAGLEPNMIFSVNIAWVNEQQEIRSAQESDYGSIVSINGNEVIVSRLFIPEGFTDLYLSDIYVDEYGFDNELNTFKIIERPDLGTRNIANAAFATGLLNKAGGKGAISFGGGNTSSGSWAFSAGTETVANGWASTALGARNITSANAALVQGMNNTASGKYSHAEGNRTTASGDGSHSEGLYTEALDIGAHAEGSYSIASAESSHAEGRETYTYGDYSHAEGRRTETYALYAHAEGKETVARGEQSHSEGYQTYAYESASHSEGHNTRAYGQYSHAEGISTTTGAQGTTTGKYAHAEGNATKATGTASHSEGYSTQATGAYSHAEGEGCIASGKGAHAEGLNTQATKNYSHAEGEGTIAKGACCHIMGKYNQVGSYPFVIGNGDSDTSRSDALSVDWNGNLKIAGDITAGGITGIGAVIQNLLVRIAALEEQITSSTNLDEIINGEY